MVRLLWVIVGLACALPAQTRRITHVGSFMGSRAQVTPGEAEVLNIEMFAVVGSDLGVGLGYLAVTVDNLDDVPRPFEISCESTRINRHDFASRRAVVAAPGRSRFFLPVALEHTRVKLNVVVDRETYEQRVSFITSDERVGLFVSDRSGVLASGLDVIQAVPTQSMPGAAGRIRHLEIRPEHLANDWRMLTSFSLLLIDGESGSGVGLSAESQDAICRYVLAGGTAIVAAADSMTAGPLRDLARKAGNEPLSHGWGSVLSIPALGAGEAERNSRVSQLPVLGPGLWPATSEMFPVQFIAGLGRAPVQVFVLVIVVFAILVGPVNLMVLRRRKKPLLALLTIPLAGFGTTLCILAYGFFHDGVGIRGVNTTCTLLDQRSHQAVSLQAQTLFAGIAPSEFAMDSDTLLLSNFGVDSEWSDRWHFNVDTQFLDGGILPSRTVKPLLSCQLGPVRDRLIVRRSADTLEVVPGLSFAPVGDWVLRDLEGRYWSGDGTSLRRVSNEDGRRQFERMRGEAIRVNVAGEYAPQIRPLPKQVPASGQPGTYACRVSAAPWLTDHGVSVDYDLERHFVFGRMHAEDFVQ